MAEDANPNLPQSEKLLRQWDRRDKLIRSIELAVVLAVVIFNIFLLNAIRQTQQDNRDANAKTQQHIQDVLDQARTNSEKDHQETIRYLRCSLLIPSGTRTPDLLDTCIANSKLPDDAQIPPITTPDGATTDGSTGAGATTNPKAPAASQPQTSSPAPTPTPTPTPTPAPQPNVIQRILDSITNVL